MPPNEQLNAAAGQTILKPGDQRVVDAAGKITKFGRFAVISDRAQVLEELGAIIGIYGKGGNGKTTLVCTLADRNLNPEGYDLPMGVIDAEAGIKSVAHLVGPDLQRIPVKSFTDVEDFVATARANGKTNFPWRTLLWDNLSDMIQKALAEQGFHNTTVIGGGKTSSQPDYNAMTTRVTLAVQSIRDLALDYGVNMIFLLWESTERTEAGVITGHRADITPKLGIRIQGILDYIGYLTVLNNPPHWTRKLDFSPNPELDSKSRFPKDDPALAIPFELYNPNFVDILNTVKRRMPFPKDKYKKPVNTVTGR